MDIRRLIASYQPINETIEIVRDTRILLVVGISAAGKHTLKLELLKSPQYEAIVSYTTRGPRYNEGVLERESVDYHFASEETIYNMLLEKKFIEAKLVHGGTVYGTSLDAISQVDTGQIAVTELDVQGVEEYKRISNDVVAVFVIPPNFDEWILRLKRRYDTDEEFYGEWPRRKKEAISELERALDSQHYRYIVTEDVSKSAQLVEQIMENPSTTTRQDDEAKLVARDLLQSIKM